MRKLTASAIGSVFLFIFQVVFLAFWLFWDPWIIVSIIVLLLFICLCTLIGSRTPVQWTFTALLWFFHLVLLPLHFLPIFLLILSDLNSLLVHPRRCSIEASDSESDVNSCFSLCISYLSSSLSNYWFYFDICRYSSKKSFNFNLFFFLRKHFRLLSTWPVSPQLLCRLCFLGVRQHIDLTW